jgi:hypothetical protein
MVPQLLIDGIVALVHACPLAGGTSSLQYDLSFGVL